MSLVPSLLQAIVHVDGEALVMHAGDKPYVVSPTGQVDLASRGLALDAVNGIVNQLLPTDLQHALDEFGAVQYELPAVAEFPGEHFTIVAARGGDDLWVEIRRRRIPDEDHVPDDFFPPREVAAAAQPYPVYASAGSPHLGAPTDLAPDALDVQSPVVDEMLAESRPDEARLVARAAEADAIAHPPVTHEHFAHEDSAHGVAAHEPRGDAQASFAHESIAHEDVARGAVEDESTAHQAVPQQGSDAEPLAHQAVAQQGSGAEPLAHQAGAQQGVRDEPSADEDVAPAPIPREAPSHWAVARRGFVDEMVTPDHFAPEPLTHAHEAIARELVEDEASARVPDVPVAMAAEAVTPAVDREEDLMPRLGNLAGEPETVVLQESPILDAHAPEAPRVERPALAYERTTTVGFAGRASYVASEPAATPEPVVIPAPAAASERIAAHAPSTAPRPAAMPELSSSREPAPIAVSERTFVQEPVAAHEPPRAPQPVDHVPASKPVAVPERVALSEPEPPEPEPESLAEPTPIAIVPPPAVVLPLARNPIRAEQSTPVLEDPTMSGLDRLLRLSAARGASTLYLSSDSRPSVRVNGELQILEGEPLLAARDVESLLLTLMPERNHEALRTGAATEWICDIEEVGRVRCMSFRDHRGPGGVFRLMPMRSVSADQLGLPKVVQGLAIEPEGLVLVAGPRSSGKRTLMSAFVDLINRTRRDHVITIEREINIVHERGSSFVSQREVRGSDADLLAAARAALREDPDVLMIEDLRTAGLMNVALEAAASGHLVVGGFAAHSATAAVDRIIDLYSPEDRLRVQLALADSLRGVIVQVLLKKKGGGRIAAREVLLNTPAVSSVIAEGKTSQIPMAIEGGRRYGMLPLNDALVGLIQQGTVDARDAYRYASDRAGLLAALKRHGLDTSFVERFA